MINIRKMKSLQFLREKKFYLHLGIAIVLSLLLLLLVFQILRSYTYHGEAITLPDYSGSTKAQLDSINDLNNFTFIVYDSVFDPNKQSGTVVAQNPLPNSKVKRNRKIYLTIVAHAAEMVKMPNLVDLSLRQARVRLEMAGLKINYLHYIPDFAQNAVLAQLFKGDTIYPDSLIQINSKIDLVLGKGYYPKNLLIPFLIGLTKAEAEEKIFEASFNLGEETYLDSGDPEHLRVYLQEPSWDANTQMNHGDFINLWYRSDLNIDFEEYIHSLTIDTLSIDSTLMDTLLFEAVRDSTLY